MGCLGPMRRGRGRAERRRRWALQFWGQHSYHARNRRTAVENPGWRLQHVHMQLPVRHIHLQRRKYPECSRRRRRYYGGAFFF